jgi:hypothetical protein
MKAVQQAGLASLYLRIDGPDSNDCLYVCTTAEVRQTPTQNSALAVWTAK